MSARVRCPWCWGLAVEWTDRGEEPCHVCRGRKDVTAAEATMVDQSYLVPVTRDPDELVDPVLEPEVAC